MTHVNVVSRYRTYPAATSEVLQVLELMAAATRKEAGNLSFDVFQGLEDPREITVLETYQSPEDFDLHRQTPHYLSMGLSRIIAQVEHRNVSTYTSEPVPHEVP